MERRGLIADRCEINRQIKADNALLRELKAAFAKISQAVKNTVPTLAEAIESLREKVIVEIINYKDLCINNPTIASLLFVRLQQVFSVNKKRPVILYE
jgi:hypothetical protein